MFLGYRGRESRIIVCLFLQFQQKFMFWINHFFCFVLFAGYEYVCILLLFTMHNIIYNNNIMLYYIMLHFYLMCVSIFWQVLLIYLLYWHFDFDIKEWNSSDHLHHPGKKTETFLTNFISGISFVKCSGWLFVIIVKDLFWLFGVLTSYSSSSCWSTSWLATLK